jgi:HEAT repeat protein
MTTDKQRLVRARSAAALLNIQKDHAAAKGVLTQAAKDDDVDVAFPALVALALCGEAEESTVAQTLVKALDSPDVKPRRAAAFLLRDLEAHAKSAVPRLRQALADVDGGVRWNAKLTLQHLEQ